MAGRGSPHPLGLEKRKDDINPMGRRSSVWESKEKLLSGAGKAPSVTSKVQSVASSRRPSNASHSSQLQIENVELAMEEELAKLERDRQGLLCTMKLIDNDISYFEKKREENVDCARYLSDPKQIEQVGKDILNVQQKLEKLYHKKSAQLIKEETVMPDIEEKIRLLKKRAEYEKKRIAEEDEQNITSDDECDLRDDLVGEENDQPISNFDRVKDFVIATASRQEVAGAEKKTPSPPTITEAIKEELERESERKELQKQILEQESKLRRAGEEAKRLQEESDRRIAEETQRKLELEARMRGLGKEAVSSSVVSVPVVPVVNKLKDETPLIHILAENNSKFLARQSYAKELPFFSGKAEEWPIFHADFERSTKDCGFSNSENMSRLRKCLRGDAAKYVQSLMVSPDNVPVVMKKLETRYGQPELIIEAMISKAKEVPSFQADELNQFIEFGSAVQNVIATIQTLNRPGHLSNPQLLKEFESKLPRMFMMQWLNWVAIDKTRLKNLLNFAEWMDEQTTLACQACPPSVNLPDIPKGTSAQGKSENSGKKKNTVAKEVKDDGIPTAAALYAGEKYNGTERAKCIFCDKHFDSAACSKARKMTIEEKIKIIQEKKCCNLCLKPGHFSKSCRSFVQCMVCLKKHLTLMCPDLHRLHDQLPKESGLSQEEKQSCESIHTASSNLSCTSKVYLKTLMVPVSGKYGKRLIRVILDDGSQRSYILKKLAEELDLPVTGNENIIHTLFSAVQTAVNKHTKYKLQLKNVRGVGFSTIEVLGQKRICGEIPRVSPGPWMKELKLNNIWISDIGEGSPEIELLIGADFLGKLLTGNILQLSNGVTAQETLLGWTLMGKRNGETTGKEDSVAMIVTSMLVSDSSVAQLWDLEVIGIRDPIEKKTKQENDDVAKEYFLKSVKRTEDGRYSVSLPWIDGRVKLPDNRSIAEKRLDSTTKRLVALQKFEDYDEIFKSWCRESIIEEVTDNQLNSDVHYIPHRAVFKPESKTTPIRPVFDASCKTQRTPSFNECLEKGPNLLELSPSILLKFREGKIGIIADIRKAFQMIEVNEADRDYLRFLWWTDFNRKIYKVYRHRRVVFGVNCSPFLLAAVLEHLLSDVQEHEIPIAQKVLKSLYVDNCVTSVNTVAQTNVFKRWSTGKLAEAKMDLREWEVGFGKNSVTCGGRDFDREISDGINKPMTSVLGYKWHKLEDHLSCDVEVEKLPDAFTKRKVLSYLQKIYDPIGLTCPVTLQPKILLQRLWSDKVGWDEELSEIVSKEFREWCGSLNALRQICIPRNMTGGVSFRGNWQLHTFCDASQNAYAAVVFLRTEYENHVSVQLLMAKSRVAPLKKPTINRLELLSCFIAATLTEFVKDSLSLSDVPTFYWSDSSTALAWIRRNDEWGTFVGNRVKTINGLSRCEDWRHVPGILNPADLPSRGCSPSQLLLSKWWEGPAWLKRPKSEWPSEENVTLEEEVAAEKKKSSVNNTLFLAATPTREVVTPWYSRKSYNSNVMYPVVPLVNWMLMEMLVK